MNKVVKFPNTKKRLPLPVTDLHTIGFLTTDDRDLWIQNKEDLLKIMAFIIREKITIYEDLK